MTLPILDCIYNLMEKMEQRYSEANFLYEMALKTNPKRILEIGTSQGGTAALFAITGAEVYTVDIKPVIDYAGNEVWYKENFPDAKINYIIGSSVNFKVIKKIKELAPFDFIFIDGSHQGEVFKDWETYRKMGKVIAFHDIQNKEDQVIKLWERIKLDHSTKEMKSDIATKWGGGWGYGYGGGIGVVYL